MHDKKRDCTYCGARGYIISNLIERVPCQYCKGTGALDVKEKRKSILVSVKLHKRLRDLAYDHKLSLADFMRKVANDYENLDNTDQYTVHPVKDD